MIRSKGEAGTGNIVEAVRHLRGIVGGIKRLEALRARGAAGGGQGAAGAARARRRGRRDRLAARAALLRRRDRDAGRRRADDAARRRGQLRRLRHLQVLGSRAPGPRDRRGDDPLRGPRRGSPPPRWSSASRCAATTSRARGRGRAAPAPRGLSVDPVEPLCRRERSTRRCAIGVLASQGDFAAHVAHAGGARRRRGRGAHPERARGPRRPRDPRRRVDDDREGDRARRARARDPRAPRVRAGRSSAPAPG